MKLPVFASHFIMAPMAGVTDRPFRERLRRNGCRALTTEMVSAAALSRLQKKTLALAAPPDLDDSLTVQIFGADPVAMGRASALLADRGVSRVDINMGCPVKKVVKTGAGAALMKDVPLAARIVAAVRASFPGILTVKTRTGWNSETVNCMEVARASLSEGADGITIHGRTKMQGYSGRADWGIIETCRELGAPLCGNGDISCALEAAGKIGVVDAVMIGRAAMRTPWIFRDAQRLLAGLEPEAPPTPAEIVHDLRLQFEMYKQEMNERAAVALMKKFAAWADKGHPGSPERRNRIMRALTERELLLELETIAVHTG